MLQLIDENTKPPARVGRKAYRVSKRQPGRRNIRDIRPRLFFVLFPTFPRTPAVASGVSDGAGAASGRPPEIGRKHLRLQTRIQALNIENAARSAAAAAERTDEVAAGGIPPKFPDGPQTKGCSGDTEESRTGSRNRCKYRWSQNGHRS